MSGSKVNSKDLQKSKPTFSRVPKMPLKEFDNIIADPNRFNELSLNSAMQFVELMVRHSRSHYLVKKNKGYYLEKIQEFSITPLFARLAVQVLERRGVVLPNKNWRPSTKTVKKKIGQAVKAL